MPSKPPAFATGAILIAGATGAQAFTAYNDLWSTVAGEYSGQNVTTYTLPSEGTASGLLVDYATGATPGYTLAITASTAPAPRIGGNGTNPAVGTDAYGEFETILNMVGFIQGTTPDTGAGETDRGIVFLTFEGLADDLLYEIVLYGDRFDATDGRPTSFTISGADSFVNASTPGTTISGLGGDRTVYDTAPNSTAGTGYVARFTDIDAGADGMVIITVADGDTDTGSNWYVNGVKLSSVPVPAPVALLGLGLIGLALQRRRQARN
jgi:hypothetical protein